MLDTVLQAVGKPVFGVLDLFVGGLDWLARNCVHIRWDSDHSHPLDSELDDSH
jgi:hypothetical protein